MLAACASTPTGTAIARQVPAAAERAAATAQQVPQSRAQINLSFAPVVRESAPAVVNIYTTKQGGRSPLDSLFADPFFDLFFRGQRQAPRVPPEQALGSGVIVREDGLIVTNHHVIEDAEQIMVVLSDRREYRAEVLGDDETADLALLRIQAGDQPLPVLPMGDSDRLEVGDLVLAIGNPFGIGKTVTSGIVSALARTTPGIGSDLSFIQTDAAINPGNSGGALVTLDGRLAGINTAIFTRNGGGSIGIGFAIPVNLVKALIRSVESGGNELARAWLGARTQPVDADLATSLGLARPVGVLVRQVYPYGPAARAGLTQGDVVLAVDGNEVLDPHGLNFRLAVGKIGDDAELEVWHNGQRKTVQLVLETPPYDPPPQTTTLAGRHPLSGAKVANMSPGLNEDLGFDPFEQGVVVVGVERGSDAARLSFRRGDIIRRLAGERIETVAQLGAAVEKHSLPWQLEIERGGRPLDVVIN
ncbi:MAG TPA: Do family serine endopeptidase [Geminicoccaceae bacterium]|nr:Do family serine endopeptidase [Geminicoccaceae bacterium]